MFDCIEHDSARSAYLDANNKLCGQFPASRVCFNYTDLNGNKSYHCIYNDEISAICGAHEGNIYPFDYKGSTQ